MKFEQELESKIHEPWREHYIPFLAMKADLERQTSEGWQMDNEREFEASLRHQAKLLYSFVTTRLNHIESQLSYAESTLEQHMPHNIESLKTGVLASVEETMTDIIFNLNALSEFIKINFDAIKKLVKLHRCTGYEAVYFTPIMQAYPLDCQLLDAPLVRASRMLDICHAESRPSQDNHSAGPLCVKFWVHKSNLNEVRALLEFHTTPQPPDKSADGDTSVSSIYLDTANLDLYTKCLQRRKSAQEIQLRWFGPITSKHILLERKMLYPDPTLQQPAEKVVCLKEVDVQHMLDDDGVRIMPAPKSIQQVIEKKHLRPMFRMFSHRTVYQTTTATTTATPLILILDTDIAFIREGGPDWRRRDANNDASFRLIPNQELLHFPYAVLSVQLPKQLDHCSLPWLEELLDSKLVYEVPLFSEFQMGISHFYRDRTMVLPWWINALTMDIRNGKAPGCSSQVVLAMDSQRKPRSNNQLVIGYLESLVTFRRSPKNTFQLSSSTIIGQSSNTGRSTLVSWSQSRSTKSRMDNCTIQVDSTDSKDDPWKAYHTSSKDTDGYLNRHIDDVMHFDDRFEGDAEKEDKKTGKKGKKKGDKGVDLQPKVMFANERTFIHWLQFSALILTGSLLLLNFGDQVSTVAGAVFLGIALILAIYAGGRFYRRLHSIRVRPDERYDDIYGPILLCTLFVGALVLNAVLRFTHEAASGTYLGMNETIQQQN